MKPILIDRKKNKIIFRVGENEMVLKADINSFCENTGVTIQNIVFPVTGYYINLSAINNKLICGNTIENLFLEIKREDINNTLLVVDFEDVDELSENFYKSYTKILLQSSNKIITINMNPNLTNEFGNFIKKNIQESEE